MGRLMRNVDRITLQTTMPGIFLRDYGLLRLKDLMIQATSQAKSHEISKCFLLS
jgi:hypothetical protein